MFTDKQIREVTTEMLKNPETFAKTIFSDAELARKMKKALNWWSMGVYAGILTKEGKILLIRRKVKVSLTGESFKNKWELPGGLFKSSGKEDPKILLKRLQEIVLAKAGIELDISNNPNKPLIGAVSNKLCDIAFIIPFFSEEWIIRDKSKAKKFFTEEELEKIAESGDLLSGKKRQYRMAKKVFLFFKRAP